MDSHILEGLTLRLEAAERGLKSARRAMWMGSLLVVAAIGGGAWWVGQRLQTGGMPEVVEAQHFVVRDAQGAARAVLQQSAGGSTQLVFFRDPLAGDEWRKHTSTGPFSFGVRALNGGSQLTLWDTDGPNFQLMPGNLSFGGPDKPMVVIATDGGPPRLWLADTTGNAQALTADLIADVTAKSAAKASTQTKHHRRR